MGRTRGVIVVAAVAAVAMVAPLGVAAPVDAVTQEPTLEPGRGDGPSPVVGDGATRPGPDLLYEDPLTDPGTAPGGRWQLPATRVSGTTVVGDGELVHTGWPYDDHGPDTIPLPLLPEVLGAAPSVTDGLFSARTGDLTYPTDRGRFAGNAADLVEVRVRPDDDGLAFRVTWNTLTEEGIPAIAVGIDVDGGDEVVDWGRGLGELGPTGVDHVLVSDGIDADLDGISVPTSTDLARGSIEVVVPDDVLAVADDAVLELFAVAGLSDGDGGFLAAGPTASSTTPGGDPLGTAPPVFDVAFRADDQEPAGLLDTEALSSQALTFGTWRSHAMATALADRDISAFSAELDVAAVRGGATASDVPTSGTVQRTYTSRFDLGEGFGTERPLVRGARQPYTLHVPSCVAEGETPVLTLALHSFGGNHGQYLAVSPGFYEQLGEARCSLVVTTLGRGPDGWYLDEAEADLFEVLADVLHTYDVELGHTLLHGYSMGGYGTYRLAGRYPDLFAAAFPVVGPPFEGAVVLAGDLGLPFLGFAPATGSVDPTTDTTPLLDSLRHVPLLAWHGTADELVPVTSAITHLQRLETNGYPYRQELFAADHFLLASLDEWERATEILGDRPEVAVDPAHVTYRVLPARDRDDLGVVADHAYWLSELRVRDTDAMQGGLIDVRSRATGEGDVTTAPIVDAGPAPLPFVARGLAATGRADGDAAPVVEVDLDNLGAGRLDLTAGRLPIGGAEDATIEVTSDGPATLTLVLERDAEPVTEGGAEVVDRTAAPEPTVVVAVPTGTSTIRFPAPNDATGGDGTGGDGTGDDAPVNRAPVSETPSDGVAAAGGTAAATHVEPRLVSAASDRPPLPVTGAGPMLAALLALAGAWALRRPDGHPAGR